MTKYFYRYFQIFSIFIYNESLPMKSYQFFKICKRFDKEREKTLMQQSMRKEKLRKVGLCFITDCFIKSFNMIINQFLFRKLIRSPIFGFWYQDDARNIKRGRRKRERARNDNIYFKNNFNRLVMKNITQTNFLYWQNVHIWRLIKVNYKRSL